MGIDGARWFLPLLKRVPELEVADDLCQEDWGVVVFARRGQRRFWIGLSQWVDEHAWLAHFHHASFAWLQRFSPSGRSELGRLLSDFHKVLANDPSVSKVAWYEESGMKYARPAGYASPIGVTQIHDPVFGRLNDEFGFWSSLPDGAADGFSIWVDADTDGPSSAQRQFFQRVLSKLAEFEQRAREYIEAQCEPFVIVGELSTSAIEIGDEDDARRGHFVLEMTDDDGYLAHRVVFSGDDPIAYGQDD